MRIPHFQTKYISAFSAEVHFLRYASSNNPAVRIIGVDGAALMTASVNPEGIRLPAGQIAIKNWSENEGVEKALLDAGIIEGEPVEWINSGFVTIPIYRLARNDSMVFA